MSSVAPSAPASSPSAARSSVDSHRARCSSYVDHEVQGLLVEPAPLSRACSGTFQRTSSFSDATSPPRKSSFVLQAYGGDAALLSPAAPVPWKVAGPSHSLSEHVTLPADTAVPSV